MDGILSSDPSSAVSTDVPLGTDPDSLSPTEEAALWERTQLGDIEAKQALVLHYQPLARIHAATLFRKRQINELKFEDFFHYALLGLMEALERFDPSKGIQFASFASYRIRGAVLNGIEKLTEKQQQLFARKRVLASRAAALNDTSSRSTEAENLFSEFADIAIGLALGCMLDGSGLYRTSQEEFQPENAYTRYELRQLSDQLKLLVDSLVEKERLIIKLHYFHGIKFEDIATEMNLTKGRISQLHHSALANLRKFYEQESGIDKAF